MKKRISNIASASGFDNDKFLKNIHQLQQNGLSLQYQLGNEILNNFELEKWLKTIYYVISSLLLEDQASRMNNNSFIQQSMQSVINSKGEYRDPKQQLAETLIILDSIALLSESGVFR